MDTSLSGYGTDPDVREVLMMLVIRGMVVDKFEEGRRDWIKLAVDVIVEGSLEVSEGARGEKEGKLCCGLIELMFRGKRHRGSGW